MIEDCAKERGLLDKYKKYVTSSCTADRYQEGFEFINSFINQDAVNSIIYDAVMNAYDNEHNKWNIPTGINELSEIIANKSLNIDSIITTNFDPLIEVGLEQKGIVPIPLILQSDGNLSNSYQNIPNSMRVIHLHGFWKDSDTLHTPKQLTTDRPFLKSSLHKILRNTTLLVIAYGGWDDIFIQSLKEIAYDIDAKVDVIWAFYESDKSIVNSRYKKLLSDTEKLSIRGRFRLYYGIECNVFFKKLHDDLLVNKKVNKANNLIKDELFLESEIKNAVQKISESNFDFFRCKSLQFKNFPAHKNIRQVEQTQFIDELKINNVISLVSDWGMDRNGFLFSIKENEISSLQGKNIYNIDLSDCSSLEDIDDRFISKFGYNIQNFSSLIIDRDDVVLLFEKITTSSDTKWVDSLVSLIEILSDFLPDVKMILSGDDVLKNLSYPIVYLKSLSEPDISNYICDHQDGNSIYLTQECFDSIVRLSSGLPSILDNILQQLKVVSIDTLIEEEDKQKIDMDNYSNNDPIPPQLKKHLKEYQKNKEKKRQYYLLEILSILQYGETFKRLKYFDSKHPFLIDDLLELKNAGLILTSDDRIAFNNKSIASEEPMLTIHPLVGKVIRQDIDKESLFNIVSKTLNLIFGESWLTGDIKFNKKSLSHHYDIISSGPSNAHVLICAFLRYSIEHDMRREIKSIFNLSLGFFNFLYQNSRYKDLVFSATEIKILIKDTSEALAIERLSHSLSKGLRMLGYYQKCIDEMQLALKNEKLFSKTEIASGKINIALSYSRLKERELAISYAKEVKKICKQNSSQYTTAELIIAENGAQESKLNELLRIKRKAEKNKFHIIKSQTILAITRLESDTIDNEKLLDLALMNLQSENYSRYCVLAQKNINLLNDGFVSKISKKDISELCNAYSYSYAQRIEVLFNRSHRVLWAYFNHNNDIVNLLTLFKYSSFMWRLNDNIELEKKYADLLNVIGFDEIKGYSGNIIRYALIRIKTLE